MDTPPLLLHPKTPKKDPFWIGIEIAITLARQSKQVENTLNVPGKPCPLNRTILIYGIL